MVFGTMVNKNSKSTKTAKNISMKTNTRAGSCLASACHANCQPKGLFGSCVGGTCKCTTIRPGV